MLLDFGKLIAAEIKHFTLRQLVETVVAREDKAAGEGHFEVVLRGVAGGNNHLRLGFFKLLCKEALEKDLPMLGVCRGMQVMNIVTGGKIYQDIGVQAGTTLKHIQQAPRSYGTHSIFVEDNTLLTDLWENKRTIVNTLHHQSCSTLGEGFKASARSADGLIEAIEHEGCSFAVGVQWHPEAMKTEEMGLLFTAFLKAAAEHKQKQEEK